MSDQFRLYRAKAWGFGIAAALASGLVGFLWGMGNSNNHRCTFLARRAYTALMQGKLASVRDLGIFSPKGFEALEDREEKYGPVLSFRVVSAQSSELGIPTVVVVEATRAKGSGQEILIAQSFGQFDQVEFPR